MLSIIKEIAADGGEWFYTSSGTISPDAMREMRNWVSDCEWADADEIDEMDSVDFILSVNHHFDGGIVAFLETLS